MSKNKWEKYDYLEELLPAMLEKNILSSVNDLYRHFSAKKIEVTYGTLKRHLLSLETQNKAIQVTDPAKKSKYWTTTNLLNAKILVFLPIKRQNPHEKKFK